MRLRLYVYLMIVLPRRVEGKKNSFRAARERGDRNDDKDCEQREKEPAF